MYQTVVDILRVLGWPGGAAPAPIATAKALETQTPEQVADVLDAWVRRCMTGRRPDGLTTDAEWYAQTAYEGFSIGKEFYEYGTQLALGQIVEIPVEMGPQARSLTEWRRNHALGYGYLGQRLWTDTPESQGEKARRLARIESVPLEWAKAGKGELWTRCVVEGLIPTTIDGFAAAYAQSTPSLDAVRNLDEQQFLDNLWAARRKGNVRAKWLDDGSLNPEWKD